MEDIDINFKIDDSSEVVEYEDVIRLAKAYLDSDFLCFFPLGTKYACNSIEKKSEVLYDLTFSTAYYTPDRKHVLLHSNIGHYGIYAAENLIYEEDWERDVEEIDY